MNLKDFYYGKIDLYKSFWVYFLFLNVVLKAGLRFISSNFKFSDVVGAYLFTLVTAYSFFSIIGTMRSAKEHREVYKFWARVAEVILWIALLFELFRVGFVFLYIIGMR